MTLPQAKQDPMNHNEHPRKWYQFTRPQAEDHTNANDQPTPQAVAGPNQKPLPPESRLFVRDQMSDYERVLLLTAYVKQLKHDLTEARIMHGAKVVDWKSIAKDVSKYVDNSDAATRATTADQLVHALHQALKRNHKTFVKLYQRIELLERELTHRGVDPKLIEDDRPERRHEEKAA